MPTQLAEHLRREIVEGRLQGMMPGVLRLAADSGVHQSTVARALRELERQGLLVSRGPGRRRLIRIPAGSRPAVGLRVGVLLHERRDRDQPCQLKLAHRLRECGHSPQIAGRSLVELGTDEARIGSVVHATKADAWIIVGGSRKVLRWFSERPEPAFALFGRMRRQPLGGAGVEKAPAFVAVSRRLLALGHRRSVYLTPAPKTPGNPGRLIDAFLGELRGAGIATGSYNVPDWQPTPGGLRRCIDALFAATPPTALLIDGAPLFTAVLQHLARHGVHAPEHVSLACTDPDPGFEWFEPSVAHIHWDVDPIVRRAVRWVNHVADGRKETGKSLFKARFVDAGTIGPVPRGRRGRPSR